MRPTQMTATKPDQTHPNTAARTVGLGALLATLLMGGPAAAQEFTFHAEPAAAFWLDEPQSTRFTPGFYLALRPGISLGEIVALQATYALLVTPAADGFTGTGSGHFLEAGIRVRPFGGFEPDDEILGGLFADANAGYVRTATSIGLASISAWATASRLRPDSRSDPSCATGRFCRQTATSAKTPETPNT